MRKYLIVALVALSSASHATEDAPVSTVEAAKVIAHVMSVLSYAERYCLPVLKVNDQAVKKFAEGWMAGPAAVAEAKAFIREENAETEARIKHDGLKPFCKSIMVLAGPHSAAGLDNLIDYRR